MNLTKEESGTTLYENLAILVVIFLAVSGLLIGARVFFLNWLPKGNVGELVSAGILPLFNIFVGIEVASSILTIFLALVIFKEETSE
jgi:multicomponent Na+:H+ antiporter subunit B